MSRITRAIGPLIVLSILIAWAPLATLAADVTTSGTAEPTIMKRRTPAIAVSVAVSRVDLAATSMAADAGLDEGIHMVDLRVVTSMELTVRLEADQDSVLAAAPRLCLTGPYWNPLDAGLSDRCWGEPDLSAVVAERLDKDAADQPVLRAQMPIELRVTLARGDTRCDYPPGDWELELAIEPLVDGVAADRAYLPDTAFRVPYDAAEVLEHLGTRDTRFCSYAQSIFTEQGEPEIVPHP